MKNKAMTIILLIALLSEYAMISQQAKADPYPMPGVMVRFETEDQSTFNTSTISIDFAVMEFFSD